MSWRAAVIGCGRIGCSFDDDPRRTQISTHAGAYAKSARASLVALVDLDREKLERYGTKFNVAGRYTDYREMLRVEKPDVVSVCTWSGTHLDVVAACVDAGVKGIFCEKPIAETSTDGERMAALCERAGVPLLVNHKRRFSPFHRAVADFVRSGRMGSPQQVNVFYVSGVANTGTHLFDLLRLYFGDVAWVEGRLSHSRSPLADDPNIDGTLWCAAGFPVTIQACDTRSFYILEIAILGSEGRLRVKTGTSEGVEWEAAEPSAHASEYRDLVHAPSPISEVDPRFEFLPHGVSHLLDCVEGKASPVCSGADGAAAVAIIEALRRSAADGRRIMLTSPRTVRL